MLLLRSDLAVVDGGSELDRLLAGGRGEARLGALEGGGGRLSEASKLGVGGAHGLLLLDILELLLKED